MFWQLLALPCVRWHLAKREEFLEKSLISKPEIQWNMQQLPCINYMTACWSLAA